MKKAKKTIPLSVPLSVYAARKLVWELPDSKLLFFDGLYSYYSNRQCFLAVIYDKMTGEALWSCYDRSKKEAYDKARSMVSLLYGGERGEESILTPAT